MLMMSCSASARSRGTRHPNELGRKPPRNAQHSENDVPRLIAQYEAYMVFVCLLWLRGTECAQYIVIQKTQILDPVDPPPHLRVTAGSRGPIPCFPVAKIAAVGH